MIVILCLEGRISPSKRTAERLVENGDALVEGGLQGPSVSAHLLLLGVRFDRISFDRALDEGGRNREPVMSALPIAHQRVPVWHVDDPKSTDGRHKASPNGVRMCEREQA
jgi:hypothetical protein